MASEETTSKVYDYSSQMLHWMHGWRPAWAGPIKYKSVLNGTMALDAVQTLPPHARPTEAGDTIPAKHLHTSLNKVKHPINVVRWTPSGRRLLTASTSGEFTLWNGTGFNFETIMQAHDCAIRAVEWTHNDDWMISGDHEGIVKTWQPTFNNVNAIKLHNDAIRDLSFSCVDNHFATACDDGTCKLVDFWEGRTVTTLTGHGWDVKSVDFHPTKELILTGSKDHLIKLWDPRTGECFNTLHSHKNAITKVQWEKTMGNCFATSARDNTARIIDLRMFRDIVLIKGHEKDITTLTFHPVHSDMLTTAGIDGSLHHFFLDEAHAPDGQPAGLPVYDHPDPETAPAHSIWARHKTPRAHDMAVWSLDWHPVGHILASGSNDRTTRFWTHPRPGDREWRTDRFHTGEGEPHGGWDRRAKRGRDEDDVDDDADGLVDQKMPSKTHAASDVPGLASLGSTGIPGLSSTPAPSMAASKVPAETTAANALSFNAPFAVPGPGGPHPLPFSIPGLDPANPPRTFEEFTKLVEKAGLPIPPPGAIPPGMALPGMALPGMAPPRMALPGMVPPAGFPAFTGAPSQIPGFPPGGSVNSQSIPGFATAQPLGQIPGFGTDFREGRGEDNNDGDTGGNWTGSRSESGLRGEGSVEDGGGNDGAGNANRRRAPLPSQEESLRMEQKKGHFTRLR